MNPIVVSIANTTRPRRCKHRNFMWLPGNVLALALLAAILCGWL